MDSKHDHDDQHGHDDGHGHDAGGHGGVGKYIAVFFALCGLTAISVYVGSFMPGLRQSAPGIMWGAMMAVSCAKASLVILFFMHLKYDKLFHSVVFISAILAAALFVGFTLMDSGQYQSSNIWDPDNPPAAPAGPRPISG